MRLKTAADRQRLVCRGIVREGLNWDPQDSTVLDKPPYTYIHVGKKQTVRNKREINV